MRSNDAVRSFFRTPGALSLACSICAVLAIAIAAWRDAGQIAITELQLSRTRAMDQQSAWLIAAITDAETGQRGYLLTGDEHYLDPYNRALATIPGFLAALRASSTSADQRQRISDLSPIISAKLAELKQTIDLRRGNATSEALVIVRGGRGKALMDEIRSRIALIDEVSEQNLARERARSARAGRSLELIAAGGLAVLLALLVVSSATIYRHTNLRDRLHREIEEARDTLAVTLASIGDAVIATDVNARVTFMNSVAEALTGWKQAEAHGQPLADVFAILNESTRIRAEDPIGKALKNGTITGLANHTILVSRDGREIPIDDSAAPIRTEDGTIVGGVLVFRNISERRQAEIERESLLERLNRSNEDLQRFAYAAAHDLHSPVNSVSAICELFERRYSAVLPPEAQEMLGAANLTLKRMSALISDLLAFSRLSSAEEQPARIDLGEAVDGALENLKSAIQAAEATIEKSSLPTVVGPKGLLTAVFQNLIGNSLKYRQPDVPPRIVISCQRDGSHWTIAVSDNGMGFDPQYSGELFKPFRRLHGASYPGSGIGLATCKAIVVRCGGRIWAHSAPGQGATFSFTLPAAAEPVEAPTKDLIRQS